MTALGKSSLVLPLPGNAKPQAASGTADCLCCAVHKRVSIEWGEKGLGGCVVGNTREKEDHRQTRDARGEGESDMLPRFGDIKTRASLPPKAKQHCASTCDSPLSTFLVSFFSAVHPCFGLTTSITIYRPKNGPISWLNSRKKTSSENRSMEARAEARRGVSSVASVMAKTRAKACAYSSSVAARKPVGAPRKGTTMSALGPPLLCATVTKPAACFKGDRK